MDGPDKHPLQAMVDGMSEEWQKERADRQMTLGDLVEHLEDMEPDARVAGIGRPISYRGYYRDVAFAPTDEVVTVSELLERIRSKVMGRAFTGYKGGEFMMGERTPVWIAPYGIASGRKLMGLSEDGGVYYPDTETETL